jgi:hypothetical protein
MENNIERCKKCEHFIAFTHNCRYFTDTPDLSDHLNLGANFPLRHLSKCPIDLYAETLNKIQEIRKNKKPIGFKVRISR